MRIPAGSFSSFLLLLLSLRPDPAGADDVELGTVEVSTARPKLLDTYGPATVVELTDRDRAHKTLGEILAAIPGVQVISAATPGQRQSAAIRGSNSRQTLVLLEGFDAADPQGGATDLSLIPLEAVESIEVYRGPKGAASGGGSLGGVIVVRLKKEGPTRFASRLSAGFFAPADFDSFAGAFSFRSHGFVLSYSRQQAQGEFPFVDTNGRERTRVNNDSAGDKLTLAFGRRLKRNLRLEAFGNLSVVSRGAAGPEQFPPELESEEARERSLNTLLGVKLKGDPLAGRRLALEVRASWGVWRWGYEDPRSVLGTAVDTSSDNHRAQVGLDTDWHVVPSWFDISLSLLGTGEFVDKEESGEAPLSKQRYLGDAALGFRLDSRRFPLKLASLLRVAAVAGRGATVVPGFDALLKAAPWAELHGSFGRSYRYPAFDELYFEGKGVRGNPDLSPEDAWGGDLGLRCTLPHLHFDLSVFYQRISNSILFVQVSPYLMEARNMGHGQSYGAELAAGLSLRVFSLSGSLAYLDTRREETDSALPLKSRFTGSVRGEWRLRRLTLYTQALFRSPFTLDEFGARREEGRVLWDAGLAVRLPAGLELALEVKNILNKRDAVDSFQQPLPGTAWFVTLGHAREENAKGKTR
jgi:vitamin B12 transporter